jgi:hypothetical protein
MVPLGVERSRWLGELAQAIDDAQRLVWEFGSSIGLNVDALDLYARLEVIRSELEDMRRARRSANDHPCWTSFSAPDPFERIAG